MPPLYTPWYTGLCLPYTPERYKPGYTLPVCLPFSLCRWVSPSLYASLSPIGGPVQPVCACGTRLPVGRAPRALLVGRLSCSLGEKGALLTVLTRKREVYPTLDTPLDTLLVCTPSFPGWYIRHPASLWVYQLRHQASRCG